MLSLASASLSFASPALPRVGLSRAGPIRANENEMEPDEGWNVDNLMDMMEDSEEAVGGPTTKEVFERPVFNYMELPGITGSSLGSLEPLVCAS